MKKITLIFFIITISAVSFGQKKEIFRDDFNNNVNTWSEAKQTNQERFFRGGQYYIVNNETGQITWNTQNVNIDQKENFIIETSVALNWQKDGEAYLVFGEDRSSKNFHCLGIYKKANKQRG